MFAQAAIQTSRSSKLQTPSTRETPNTKRFPDARRGFCVFLFGASLELGAWDLEL
jgi:hypothetical protein